MAAAALVLSRGSGRAAAAVLSGGLLIAVSYRTITAGVGSIVAMLAAQAEPLDTRRKRAIVIATAARLAGRYALLALLAYVMIARLRLHPVGLLVGVSSVVAGASGEALRLYIKKS